MSCMVIVSKLICRYVVGTWSVKAVGTWLVCGQHNIIPVAALRTLAALAWSRPSRLCRSKHKIYSIQQKNDYHGGKKPEDLSSCTVLLYVQSGRKSGRSII